MLGGPKFRRGENEEVSPAPRAQDWIQRDAAGKPILLTYGFQQSFRYRPCFSNQEYLDYYKTIVRFGFEDVSHVNPHGITGGNRAWQAGLDHARFLKWTEAYVTEERNDPDWLPDGRLISKIRSYKLGRTFRNILLTHIPDDPAAIAEDLAFNQTIAGLGSDPLAPVKLTATSSGSQTSFTVPEVKVYTIAVVRW